MKYEIIHRADIETSRGTEIVITQFSDGSSVLTLNGAGIHSSIHLYVNDLDAIADACGAAMHEFNEKGSVA